MFFQGIGSQLKKHRDLINVKSSRLLPVRFNVLMRSRIGVFTAGPWVAYPDGGGESRDR